ncbi:MAG: hypothetical protein AAF298_10575 [Cyanobacteria bacterium P01_A01_bin.40]
MVSSLAYNSYSDRFDLIMKNKAVLSARFHPTVEIALVAKFYAKASS